MVGHIIHGQVKQRGFSLIRNFFFIFFIAMNSGCNEKCHYVSEVSLFLGPPVGETISLEDFEGNFTNRTCVHVSENSVYHIEERQRLLPSKISNEDIEKFNIPPEVVQVIEGKKDFVNKYTLQEQNGKLILNSLNFPGEENVLIDFTSDEWVNYGKSPNGEVKMVSHIVKSEKRVLLGKTRTLLFVETGYDADGEMRRDLDVFAEGLGLIRREHLDSNAPMVSFSIKGY